MIEAETGGGVEPLQDYVAWPGWTSYWGNTYSGVQAAITRRTDQEMSFVLDRSIPAGDYVVTLSVLDYGTGGLNQVDVAIGDSALPAAWGSTTFGVRDVRVGPLRIDPGTDRGRTLRLGSRLIEQPALIVDTVTIAPARPGDEASER